MHHAQPEALSFVCNNLSLYAIDKYYYFVNDFFDIPFWFFIW